ncbi:MAG: hypothetical protein ACD_3C00033G0001, partial [uncultured bacterium (gcode 4)]
MFISNSLMKIYYYLFIRLTTVNRSLDFARVDRGGARV